MKKAAIFTALGLLAAVPLIADISLTDKGIAVRAALKAANQAKRDASRSHHAAAMTSHGKAKPFAEGSLQLTDSAGLEYFINTNITFSGSTTASGGASEASYTHAVVASTQGGGTVSSTLSDMFDQGYNSLCVSLNNTTGPCVLGPNFTMYEKLGPASVDATVPAVPECIGRQYVFPQQTVGGLHVQRKVYVPTNDTFIRWVNFFTNTTGAPITFTTGVGNNLGSDSNTIILSSSSGDAAAQTNDTWITTFQNWDSVTHHSTDPRIGHILQGTGAPTPVSNINFTNGNDEPWWNYSITLNPGQTKAIVNFATGGGNKTLVASQAAAIANFGTKPQQCLSATELSEVVNFVVAVNADLAVVKSTNVSSGTGGIPVTYKIQVTNNGPATATGVSVTDVVPAGMSFTSASGTGWTCGFSAGTVTCTMPSLAVGAANPISLVLTPANSGGSITNTAHVTSSTNDPNLTNNSSTTTALPVAPSSTIPALDKTALALLAAVIALFAAVAIKR